MYDQFTSLAAATLGDNLHFGYWEPPECDLPFAEATDRLTDLMTDYLGLSEGSRVLDVGCGVGTPALRIVRRTGAHVRGISVSQEQVTRANAAAAAGGLADRATFHRADARELPFPRESFDGAIALESIIHMPDRVSVLREIRQALRPGGRLVLTDFFERAPIPPAKRPAVDRYLNDFLMTMVRVEDYLRMLPEAGLRFEAIVDISEQTLRRTFLELSARIGLSRGDLDNDFDPGMVDQFDPGDLADIPEFGYLLVVARRPTE